LWPYREQPGIDSRKFLAHREEYGQAGKNKLCGPVSAVPPDIMARPLMWLMLFAIAMGKCLMNGYSIFKEQPIHHEKAAMGRKEHVLSPYSRRETPKSFPVIEFY
jgi:hypothetical protein